MIYTIGIFQAQEGARDALCPYLEEHLALARAHAGCLGGQIALSVDDPNRLVMVTHWESRAAHEEMEANLRENPDAEAGMVEMMRLLVGPPTFGRYVPVDRGQPTEDVSEGVPHCRECGMSMATPEEHAWGDVTSEYCRYCASAQGTLSQAMSLGGNAPVEPSP